MGCPDVVMVPCPKCGVKREFQSKGSDDMSCRKFELDNCPDDVMSNVNRHAPKQCSVCGTWFDVEFEIKVVSAKSVEYIYD